MASCAKGTNGDVSRKGEGGSLMNFLLRRIINISRYLNIYVFPISVMYHTFHLNLEKSPYFDQNLGEEG